MKRKTFSLIVCVQLLLACGVFSIAQELTVKQIMADPSIAGLRPEGERISPDGAKVVFFWNDSGKDPKNMYLWNGAGDAKVILKPADLGPLGGGFGGRRGDGGGSGAAAATSTAEEGGQTGGGRGGLNYGLNLRDEFSRRGLGGIGGVDWSPDSKRILFTSGGDLWVMNIAGDMKPKRLTRTQSPESFARWLDDRRVVFSQSGNIFVVDIEHFFLVQLTREANPVNFIGVGNSVASEDGAMMAYTVTDNSKQRALVVPNYLGEYVEANQTRRGFSTDQKIYVIKTDGSTDRALEVKLPKPEGVGYLRGIRWAADNRSLLVDRVDKDLHHRQLFYVFHPGSKDEQIIPVIETTDDKWEASLSRIVEPNPKDASQVIFGSEKDGYNHLYLATLEKSAAQPNPTGEQRQENTSDAGYTGKVDVRQLTKGNFEVDWAKYQGDGKAVFYSSTQGGTATRDLYVLHPDQNAEGRKIDTGESGMKQSPQIDDSPANPMAVYENSQWNKPAEIFVARLCDDCKNMVNPPLQITHSTPEAFGKMPWSAPKFIDIPAKDGKPIKSKIYLPAGFSAAGPKKYPMVIFVHGAGYLQNTINGWNNYYREFMFNELLVQKGYVVLDIDYRGSAGYGRDWRTDVYDFLGGLDMQDHLDAIDFVEKNYDVDPKRVGVYGGSYGGFMAEMLAFRAGDKITAAAALRPVADWKNYYASSPVYTAERLGFPEKNPEGYKRSSPIAYADKLATPLLILHGLQDDNVHVQDSVQLTEKLIRLGKTEYFEEMFYPAESHGFTRPESWTDEYTRILMFFEKHLR
jgi:dipeptidyl aminopeptidase/acylaminoacyl peptidase